MPLTFSHPAAVIPFLKNKRIGNSAAIIIGSMAPDFEYFIFFKPLSYVGHSWFGILASNVVLSLIIYFLFYKIVKDTIMLFLPLRLTKYFDQLNQSNLKINSIQDFFSFYILCVIGSITHVFWDSFTHKTGFFVEKIEFLKLTFLEIPIFKYLQHFSTIVGLVIILFFLYKRKGYEFDGGKKKEEKILFWFFIILFQILLFIFFWRVLNISTIGGFVVCIFNSSFVSFFGGCIYYKYFFTQKSEEY